MAVCLCCLKLQSDWPGLCSETVSTVLSQCRLAAELPTAVELCPPRHAGLSAEEAKPSTPAPGVCQQNPGAPASPWTEILPPPPSSALYHCPRWRHERQRRQRASHRVVPQREGTHPDR
ncbi:hypothetical protein KUCAC02_029021 [Chaenocephalus aceratus]|uniref:Uncharacterized protein n=1 Tax=Chaenocephalus aceratus TaxID=36190 RepID=A0ACB9X3J1_CHAAC|nr:hypothetical protein KUCAC02_029021 [Chaenocephalus aceratus]